MKKYLFLVTTLLLTISMSVSAQRGNRGNRQNLNNRRTERQVRMSPKERADLMAKELNLTEKQKAEVESLCEKQDAERLKQITEHRAKRETARQARNDYREEMRVARQKSVEKHNAELAKIIGEEKVEKWNEFRKSQRDLRRDSNRRGRRNFSGRNR